MREKRDLLFGNSYRSGVRLAQQIAAGQGGKEKGSTTEQKNEYRQKNNTGEKIILHMTDCCVKARQAQLPMKHIVTYSALI